MVNGNFKAIARIFLHQIRATSATDNWRFSVFLTTTTKKIVTFRNPAICYWPACWLERAVEPSEDFVHQHQAVVAATSLLPSWLVCLVSQLVPLCTNIPVGSCLLRHRPRSSCPLAFVPLTCAPSLSPMLLPRLAAAACPACGLATDPPPALLPPVRLLYLQFQVEEAVLGGILAETEVFGFLSLSRNAGNPTPAAHPVSGVRWVLLLLWGRVLGSVVDTANAKMPLPVGKLFVVLWQGLNARSLSRYRGPRWWGAGAAIFSQECGHQRNSLKNAWGNAGRLSISGECRLP